MINILHLYYDLLNLYGENANVRCLVNNLKRNDLLQYVDYGLLTYGFASGFLFNHPVCILADFTQQLVLNIDNPDELFTIDTHRYKYSNFDSWYCNDWFTCLFSEHIYTLITKSDLMSQDYKDIINCYNEMYNSYWDFSFNNDIPGSEDDKFEKFMICSYYYFAFNNKINSEKDRIISFIAVMCFSFVLLMIFIYFVLLLTNSCINFEILSISFLLNIGNTPTQKVLFII